MATKDIDARPPVLKAEPDQGRSSEPESVSRIMSQKVRFRMRPVLLSNGQNVQGKLAPQCNHELVHVGKAREQGRRDKGIGKQVQKGAAGIVFVVVR